jgi:hypothetical protein
LDARNPSAFPDNERERVLHPKSVIPATRYRLWEEIALSLLKQYTARYYTFRKREWELPHLEFRDLESDDPNFPSIKDSPDENYYRILIDKSQEEIVAKLEELKALIEKGDLKPWEFQGMKAIWFGRHLYDRWYISAQISSRSALSPSIKGNALSLKT